MKKLFFTLTLLIVLTYSSWACTAGFSYSIYGDSVAVHGGMDVSGTFTYTWNFGEGAPVTGQHTGHRYANIGTFNICLIVTNNNGCTSDVCHEVVIPTPACETSFTSSLNGLTGTFHGTSNVTTGLYYNWSFGDNQSGSGENPSHTYANYGAYQVCLTVYDGVGCQATYCDSVHITQCQAYFNTQSTTNPVAFVNYSQGNELSYSWNFGDGETSDAQTPSHSYSTSGTYHVCLTIHNTSGCENTFCRDITISVPSPCEASYTYSVSGSTVSLTGSSSNPNVDYHWIFGDGSDANGQNLTHTYTQYPEHYDVCLVIYNTALGCIDTVCQNIFVEGPPPACQAYFNTQSTTNPVVFANYSQGSNLIYSWNFGDGGTSDAQAPSHTYAVSGTYHVCLTIHNSLGCENTFCRDITVTVTTGCQAYFNFTNTENLFSFQSYSQGDNLSYLWNFGDGATSTDGSPQHTFEPGTYQVCLTIHNSSGCESHFCREVVVAGTNSCHASFTYDVNGNNVILSGASTEPGVLYYWHFGDGSVGSGQTNTHTYANYPEHYDVCLEIVNTATGCHDTVCQNIYVQTGTTSCEANFTYTVSGTEVHFHGMSNVSGVTYHWNFGDNSDANGENVTHNYTVSPEHYVVCLTIYNTNTGCQDSYCDTVFVESTTNTACDASFTFTLSGSEVHFDGSSNIPGVYYYWNFGDGTTGGGENPVHNYADSTAHYNVCLTIYNGNGCQNTQCETVNIEGTPNNSDCEASFTYVIEGNVVAFHGMSTVPGVYYYWSFGDGVTGSGENPTHTFTAFPEHYNVCLTIYNNNGCQNTICQTIYIAGQNTSECHGSFTYTVTDNIVHVVGSSTDPNASYYWIFGDGTTGNGQAPDGHTYTQFPEHYNVCLITVNTATNCHDTICQTVYVQHGSQSTCSAAFTYTITGNEVHFAGPSNPTGTHYLWSFGDGGSSDMHNPNHAYALFPEHYEACLTVTNTANNCNETSCQTIFVEHENSPDLLELSGTIYTGLNYADAAEVWLIQYDVNLGSLLAVDHYPLTTNGHYVFHVPAGNYFLKAALLTASAHYANYLPTYFEHELFWYNADVISLTSNLNRNIHLIEGNNPGGPGFISGLVTEGANKTEGPGDPVANVQVMLLSMDDEPLQYTTSDAFGEFSFSNVAYGTYKVYGEVYNLTTTPAIVTVEAGNQQITDIALYITSKEVTTGVDETSVINESAVGNVFPNPFKGDAAINISLQKDARLSIRILDIAGRQVYADIMNFTSGVQQINLPVSELSAGIYNLTLSDEKSNSMVTRKLVKTE